MALDPRALSRFLTVCQEGSIGAAARRLHVTQPAVSATMRQLEDALDAPLFTRTRSGIRLTSAGLALRRRAEAMAALLEQAERESELVRAGVAGPLILGGTPGALASLVPRAVRRLSREIPAFELQVLERADDELSEMLRNGRIELAIVTTGMVELPGDLAEEAILPDPYSLIVGRHNDNLPDRLALGSLDAARWVLPHAAGAFRRQVDALFVRTRTPLPTNAIRCDSLLTTKAIVRETDYVTILPREVAAAELESGVLRAIRVKGAFVRQVGVRLSAGHTLSPVAAAFLTALRREGTRSP